jgi:hypothetical protein
MNTTRFIAKFAGAIAELRPDWHRAGIAATIRNSDHQPAVTAVAILCRAANPNNRTPALQPADYDQPTTPCRIRGAWPHGRCAGCLHDAETEREPWFVVGSGQMPTFNEERV